MPKNFRHFALFLIYHLELCAVKGCIESVFSHKLVVSSLLHYFAVPHNEYLVGVFDSV